jgi:TfoX/Sxy family transcriptional regulator of competence genes
MATNKDFAEYVLDQLGFIGNVSLRPMFGEYGLYLEDKVVGFVCDNTVFLKITPAGQTLLGPDAPTGPCYPGSKPYFILEDIEDQEAMRALLVATYQSLPAPKPKRIRPKKES